MDNSASNSARPSPRGLTSRILALVVASSLVTALAVSAIAVRGALSDFHRNLERTQSRALVAALEPLLGRFASGQRELEQLATGFPKTRRIPDSALARSPHFGGLAFLADGGHVIHALGSAVDLSPETMASLAADAPTLVGSAEGPIIAVPGGRSDSRSGTLIGVFRAAPIRGLLRAARPDEITALSLIDSHGATIAGPQPATDRIGQIAESALPEDDPSSVRRDQNALAKPVIGSAVPLGMFGCRLLIETPRAAAYGPIQRLVKQIVAVDLVLILLFGGLAYRMTRTAMRPIQILSDDAQRIAAGQFDLKLSEPEGNDEVALLARSFDDMVCRMRNERAEIRAANQKLRDHNTQLEQANEVLSQLSITDGLTKLHNHRYFQDSLIREIKRVRRVGEPLGMLLIDLDDFKKLNDRRGHAAGDELLAGVARILHQVVRETDLLARYGGEEFVVMCVNTDRDGTYQLGEKIRLAIAESSFIVDDSMRPTGVTVSVGVAAFNGDRKEFFHAADRALYEAKAQGKNCVVSADGKASF
ncbi:MAG: diguanylate cyclase [Myxococcota bacterium]